MESITRTIKYQSDLDLHFREHISSLEGGDKIKNCIQCGMCSATCPLSIYMDITPRRVMAMVRAGFKKEVLSSKTIWLCTSCYSCTVHCPENIKITDVMYALKRMAIHEGSYPRGLPIPVLAKTFFDMVTRKGRSSEFRLVFSTFLKVSIAKLLSMAPLGWKLFRQGRMPLRPESIKKTRELRLIMQGLKEAS